MSESDERSGSPSEESRRHSRDEDAVGWGDEHDRPDEDADLARLLADRPPHHDRP